jgi:putative SOS response-associated peptidase YedK
MMRIRPGVLADVFELMNLPEFVEQVTCFPAGPVVAIVQEGAHRIAKEMHWRFIPNSAGDPDQFAKKYHTWNARAETIDTSPTYRQAFRQRRCLIPATGFYVFTGPKGKKSRHYVGLKEQAPYAYAGVWEHWQRNGRDPIESCAIVTTMPNTLMKPLDDRMPVILPSSDYDAWLDPENDDATDLKSLLRPYPAESMETHPA